MYYTLSLYHRQQNKCYPQRFFYLPISKLHSILVVANLLAHNNKSQICYCGQILLQSAALNCRFSDNLTPLGVTLILLAMVPICILKGSSNSSHSNFCVFEKSKRGSVEGTRNKAGKERGKYLRMLRNKSSN